MDRQYTGQPEMRELEYQQAQRVPFGAGGLGVPLAGGAINKGLVEQSGIHSTLDDTDRLTANFAGTMARLLEKLHPYIVEPDALRAPPPAHSERPQVSAVRLRMMQHNEALAQFDLMLSQIIENLDN